MNGDIVVAMKLLGAGLAMAGMIGPGIGIGLVVNGALQALGRNPEAGGVAPRIHPRTICQPAGCIG